MPAYLRSWGLLFSLWLMRLEGLGVFGLWAGAGTVAGQRVGLGRRAGRPEGGGAGARAR